MSSGERNEDLILIALSGLPLEFAELQHYTGIPQDDLWVALTTLQTRGLVHRTALPRGPESPPLRFVRVRR